MENSPSPNFNVEIHQLPEARRQLIFRIRRQIAEGVYDDEQKLQLAVERLVDRVAFNDDDVRDESRF